MSISIFFGYLFVLSSRTREFLRGTREFLREDLWDSVAEKGQVRWPWMSTILLSGDNCFWRSRDAIGLQPVELIFDSKCHMIRCFESPKMKSFVLVMNCMKTATTTSESIGAHISSKAIQRLYLTSWEHSFCRLQKQAWKIRIFRIVFKLFRTLRQQNQEWVYKRRKRSCVHFTL